MKLVFYILTSVTLISCSHKQSEKENNKEKILNTFLLGSQFDPSSLDTNKLFTTTFRYEKAYSLSQDIYCVVKPQVDRNKILKDLFLFYGNNESTYYQRIIEADKDYFLDIYRSKYGNESLHKIVNTESELAQLILDIEVFGGLATFQFENQNKNPIEVYTWSLDDKNISLFFRKEDVIVHPNKIYAAIAKYSLSKKSLEEIKNESKENQKKKDLQQL